MKYWEIVADNLSKAGWSLGWVSVVDHKGRTIWIVDAHRDDGKRFIARSDEKLTAFVSAFGRADLAPPRPDRHGFSLRCPFASSLTSLSERDLNDKVERSRTPVNCYANLLCNRCLQTLLLGKRP